MKHLLLAFSLFFTPIQFSAIVPKRIVIAPRIIERKKTDPYFAKYFR